MVENLPLYPPCECEYGRLRSSAERLRFRVIYDCKAVDAIGPLPDRVCFAREFLAEASKYVQIGDGIITFTLDNGTASYGIVGENLMLNTVCGVKSPDLDQRGCP